MDLDNTTLLCMILSALFKRLQSMMLESLMLEIQKCRIQKG
jgi:hypothetical protein